MSLVINETLSLANLQRPDVRANPYPLYDQLRDEDPVHWDESLDFWVLTRYSDVASVYDDPRFSRAQGLRRGYDRLPATGQQVAGPLYDSFAKTMFYADPPYHTCLRRLVSKAFTPRAVEQMRPHIQRIADELLDAVQDNGHMDVIQDFAYPLPILVITEMLGLPAHDRKELKAWSDDLFAILGTVRRHTPESLERAGQSLKKLTDYVTALSVERRVDPQNDLLSALVAVVEHGKHLSQEELVANVNILLSSGHETTSNLIGNGLLALLQHPGQMRKLREQPELVGLAVDEMIRYDCPVQVSYRSAAEDVELGGKVLRKGDLVNMVLGAANRDPARFPFPNDFDIARDEGRHLGLGLGIHFCLGAPLLRLEAEIVFNTMLRRFPEIQLASDSWEWQEQPIFRGVKSLPIVF